MPPDKAKKGGKKEGGKKAKGGKSGGYGDGDDKGKGGAVRSVNILDKAAMENAQNICHNVQVFKLD